MGIIEWAGLFFFGLIPLYSAMALWKQPIFPNRKSAVLSLAALDILAIGLLIYLGMHDIPLLGS